MATATKTARNYQRGMNEGGYGFNPHIDVANNAARQAHEAAWSRETTQKRRVAWNSFVQAITVNGRVDMRKVANKQAEQGWTMTELQAAIKRHGL